MRRERVVEALQDRQDLKGWSAARTVRRGVQSYAVPNGLEAVRQVEEERYQVSVLRETRGADGEAACGSANATFLPGDDVGAAIDSAAERAGFLANPPHGIPDPEDIPDVPLADTRIQDEPLAVLGELYERLQSTVGQHSDVRLTSAEFFANESTTTLANSRGLDAEQTGTSLSVDWVLSAGEGEEQTESFFSTSRRRLEDLDVEGTVERHSQYVTDLRSAGAPEPYRGPVVLRGITLAEFMNAPVLKVLSSAELKYKRMSPWDIGRPVLTGEVKGDPLTIWANRRLPYGVHTSRFDQEGLAARRLLLIEGGILKALSATQQYAEYLSIPPTGGFGNIEVAPGSAAESELLAQPHVEVVAFSWFNPNPVTGEFSAEIRQGYLATSDGRSPFRGGLLVGNMLKALTDVQFSSETGFYGDYQGPTTARFAEIAVTAGTSR
ncbi:MAG: metallopeptidase TldD-related protein [Anaerolineae bacterium]